MDREEKEFEMRDATIDVATTRNLESPPPPIDCHNLVLLPLNQASEISRSALKCVAWPNIH